MGPGRIQPHLEEGKTAGAHPGRKPRRGTAKAADFKPATFQRFRIVAETQPHPNTSEVGRFLQKRHVRRHGPPQRSDRSEIGSYLGSPRTTSGWPKNPPHPSASEVGRFLQKRHVRRHGPLGDRLIPRKSSDYIRVAKQSTSSKHLRGRTISPKAPGPQTRTAAEIGPSQTRTARRSVPT